MSLIDTHLRLRKTSCVCECTCFPSVLWPYRSSAFFQEAHNFCIIAQTTNGIESENLPHCCCEEHIAVTHYCV